MPLSAEEHKKHGWSKNHEEKNHLPYPTPTKWEFAKIVFPPSNNNNTQEQDWYCCDAIAENIC